MMEQALKDLCATRNIDAVSVTVDAIFGKTSVFLHWRDPRDRCAYGIAGTYEAALQEAIVDMDSKRETPRRRERVRSDRHVAENEIPF